MEEIKKQYIVDDQNRKIAVQIDYKTFEKIEEILEDYSLVQLMKENDEKDILNESEAKSYYKTLVKVD
ncbi:MAG: hypothetical protein IIB05_11765 [Bacteroidetes bacterium]|nr:hypothetical protein [Bacteroidota bacterium]